MGLGFFVSLFAAGPSAWGSARPREGGCWALGGLAPRAGPSPAPVIPPQGRSGGGLTSSLCAHRLGDLGDTLPVPGPQFLCTDICEVVLIHGGSQDGPLARTVLAMSSCFGRPLVTSVLRGHVYPGTMTTSHYRGHLLPVPDVVLNIKGFLAQPPLPSPPGLL